MSFQRLIKNKSHHFVWHFSMSFLILGTTCLYISFTQNNVIHMKIGGDHGNGSFKMSYQIANVHNANSTDNTIVFSIFKAKYNHSNIKIGLNRFREQVKALQSITLKYELLLLSENTVYSILDQCWIPCKNQSFHCKWKDKFLFEMQHWTEMG